MFSVGEGCKWVFIMVIQNILKCIIYCTIILVIKITLKYNRRKSFLVKLLYQHSVIFVFSHYIANVSLFACFLIIMGATRAKT